MSTVIYTERQNFGCRDSRNKIARGHEEDCSKRCPRVHGCRYLKDIRTCLNEEHRDLNLEYNASQYGCSLYGLLQRSNCPETLSN